MVREYEMTGTMPIIVGGYGRVEPYSGKFQCEMEAVQESFFVRIGAVRVLRDLPEARNVPLPPRPIDGVVEFEGRTLTSMPTGWPHRPSQEDPE